MANSFTIDVTQWQMVDKTPTPNSANLVESSGVADEIIVTRATIAFPSIIIYDEYYNVQGVPTADPNHKYRRLPMVRCYGAGTILFKGIQCPSALRLFNEQRQYIINEDIDLNVGDNTITIPSNAAYFGMYWTIHQSGEVDKDYSNSFIETKTSIISHIPINTKNIAEVAAKANNNETIISGIINDGILLSNKCCFEDIIVDGEYYDVNGNVVANSSYWRFPPIYANSKIYVEFNDIRANSLSIRWADKNNNIISTENLYRAIGHITEVTPPQNAVKALIYGSISDGYDYSDSYIYDINVWAEEHTSEIRYVKSKNIYSKESLVSGYIKSNGTINISSSYKTTPYIPIKNGQSIAFSPRVAYFLAFKKNLYPITSSYISTEEANYVYTASEDGYIRATFAIEDVLNDNIQIEYSSSVTDRVSPNLILTNVDIEKYEEAIGLKSKLELTKLSLGWFKEYIIYDKYYNTDGTVKDDSNHRYRMLPLIKVPAGAQNVQMSLKTFNNQGVTARCYNSKGSFIGSLGFILNDDDIQVCTLTNTELEDITYLGLYWRKASTEDDYMKSWLSFDDISNHSRRLANIEKNLNVIKQAVTIANSDKIAIIGDSYTESHYTVKNKAYINKLSLFSDFEFVNWGRSGDIYLGRLNSIREGNNYYGTQTFKDIAPKYAMMCCYTNDIKYMGLIDYIKCLDNICTTLVGIGTTPIICTEYHTDYNSESDSNVKTCLKNYADEHGYLFWDIATYADLTRKGGFSYKYPPFWSGSHAGTRTNAIEADPYEMYLKGMERPEKSLKLFRLRGVSLPVSLDDIIFRTNEDRAKLFTEICVGHTYITDPANVDNCTSAAQSVCNDEYQLLQKKSEVIFGAACLVSCVLPAKAMGLSSIKLKLSSSGVSHVYALNRLASPYTHYNRYSRFDYTALNVAPQAGDTYIYEDGGTTYTVVKVVEGAGDYGSLGYILCSPANVNTNTGGTLTKVSGSGDPSIPFSYKSIGYDILSVNNDTCGHWEELTGNGGEYEVTNIMGCVEDDKIHFLISGSNIKITDVSVEFIGTVGKVYDQKQIELKYNRNNLNQELLPSNTFANAGTLDTDWNVTPIDIYEKTQGYDVYPVGCNSVVKVTDSVSLDCVIDSSNLKPFKNIAWLEIWCRYFPDVYSDGSGNQITEISYDYNDLVVEIGSQEKLLIELKERINTHWKIVRKPVVINDNLTDLCLSIKSDSKGIEVAYVSLKYE
jgi:hypothetical protein